jgi:hypothetical protein
MEVSRPGVQCSLSLDNDFSPKLRFMKKLLLITGILFTSLSLFAQSAHHRIRFNKTLQPALMLELPYSADETEGTIISKLKQIGYDPATKGSLFWKKNTQDGFYVFKQVNISALGSRTVDLYFKVNKKKKNDGASHLYMLISDGQEAFINPQTNMELWHDARAFLDGFTEAAESYKTDQGIITQETQLKTLRSKYASLQADQKELEERIIRYQKELETNLSRQKEAEKEMENRTRELEAARSKRSL